MAKAKPGNWIDSVTTRVTCYACGLPVTQDRRTHAQLEKRIRELEEVLRQADQKTRVYGLDRENGMRYFRCSICSVRIYQGKRTSPITHSTDCPFAALAAEKEPTP